MVHFLFMLRFFSIFASIIQVHSHIMKRIFSLQVLLSLAFAVGVTCFFALLYPHHLHFQEQYQLFQFDWNYAFDLLSVPGGLAEWLSRFCVQFFLSAWAGAAIIALVLTVIQRQAAGLIKEKCLYGLSFVPSVLLFFFLFDENAKFGAVWAILLSLIAVGGLCKVRNLWLQFALFYVLTVPVYWAAGPVSVVFISLSLFRLLPALNQQKGLFWAVSAFAATLLFAGVIPSAAHHVVNYELIRFYYGILYHNDWMHASALLWTAAWLLSFLPLIQLLLRKPLPKKTSVICSISVPTLVMALICWLFQIHYNPRDESVMKYDFMARFQQWNRILLTSREKTPNNQIEVTALNLALGLRAQLSEHMFEYRQNGLSGLLPVFERDPVSPLTTSEVYYHLGMINTAQRYVFEAQEAIPSYQKSARCYKRLAQTNLILGNYEVSRKYLLALQKTLLYRNWANETLALLGDEEAINNHPEYGNLRKNIIDQNFFFSDSEVPQMLGQLLMANRQNRLAYEYLEAAYLLSGNLEDFVKCLNVGQELGYKNMPKHFQEAYILWWSRDHTPDEKAPSHVSPSCLQGLNQYYSMAQNPGVSNDALARQYGRTYWHYFFTNFKNAR